MKCILTRFVCAKCSNAFTAPEILPGSYGEFLLRSPAGELAYLNGLEDPTYGEVSDLLATLPQIAILAPGKRAGILQRIYGEVACDPGASGLPFSILAMPHCPRCNSQEMASWEPTDPAQVVEIVVPHVTYHRWSALSEDEKTAQLKRASSP